MTPLGFLVWCGVIFCGLLLIGFAVLVLGACISAVKNIKAK